LRGVLFAPGFVILLIGREPAVVVCLAKGLRFLSLWVVLGLRTWPADGLSPFKGRGRRTGTARSLKNGFGLYCFGYAKK